MAPVGYLNKIAGYKIAEWERDNAILSVDDLATTFINNLKKQDRDDLLFKLVRYDIEQQRKYRMTSIARVQSRSMSAADYEADRLAWQKYREEVSERARQQRKELVDTIRSQVELEITTKLLRSQFVGHNGKRITWGKASIEDHYARITFLLDQANGNVVGANKHEAAIKLLNDRSAQNLNEVYQNAAA